VASGWHNKLARLFHADWNEIRTRGGQEFHKRSELLFYRLGGSPAQIHLPAETSAAAASTGSPASRQPKFFFAPGEAAACAELLRTHLPDQSAAIIKEADEICQHRFRLLGYEDLDYGPEIDWHLDRVHNQRAPLDPWFKIPFLDFAVVGDHKVTWELNRHQHLVTLAKAWLLTGDQKYPRELMAQWRSWLKANPYPLGINWGSTLEVAFRSLSWIWIDHLLIDAPSYAEFRAELLPALAFHGQYIERYLSTYFSPNTHLLGEALAMFFIGALYPQFPRAQRWRDNGWKILLHEAGRQVRPDGVYFEQSLYYHVYALDFFLHARLLAKLNNIEIPNAYDEVISRMIDVVEALAHAGPAEGFGDDDGGRLFNPRRNRTEHMTDPLALGALAFDRDSPAAQLTEESIWLFGPRAVSKLPSDRPQKALSSRAFPDGGIYVIAGTDPRSTMAIDAGPFGVGRCGHGHADALSLRLTINGARWLVDSGSGVYISKDPSERNGFRGTAAHNALRVDGVDQAIPDEPFSWQQIPTTRVETWIAGKTFSYFCGVHNGYERLADPVTHRRSVLRLDTGSGSLWLVRDVALGHGEHDLELNWHFAADVKLRELGNSDFVASRPEDPTSALRLVIPDQTEWTSRIVEGTISPAYGSFEPAPILQSNAHLKLPAEVATAIIATVPATMPHHLGQPATLTSTQQPDAHIYELHEAGVVHSFYFAGDQQPKQPWTAGPWFSDAEVLVVSVSPERLEHLLVIDGSSLAWRGEPLFNPSAPFHFFEWHRKDSLIHSVPENLSTTPVFEELTSSLRNSSSVSHPTSAFVEKH
jgi:hypothetical protein